VEALLFVAHRIPYPPNKGDKIRSYHLLRGLSKRYRVHLAAFVDDPDDWRHAGALDPMVAERHLVPLHPRAARARSVAGLATGEALSVRYFRDARMRSWVAGQLTRGVRRVVAFSSPVAQYVDRTGGDLRVVVDFVDVDSDKWRQYAQGKRWPMSWVYRREASTLLRFERRTAARADASVFVSRAEADLFRRLAPEVADRVTWVENGVDTSYFDPDVTLDDPYGEGSVVAFTGAMDYWANVDAVTWFAETVWPEVLRRRPGSRFAVVGSRPDEAVRRLAQRPGVLVTGRVDDIRPYLRHAAAAVAPLRIARGIQNKVLEAMAMARPTIASQAALDGLELPAEGMPTPAATERDWVERVVEALDRGAAAREERFREAVRSRYSWDGNCDRMAGLLED
jgi:sugar transferase (PEP-CTERM/EpsH1 system associated)